MPEITPAPRAPSTIIVIDDDAAVLDSTLLLLEIAGFVAAGYASATAFLSGPGEPGAACILLDQHMPGMTGIELLEELRVRGIRVPAILMTGQRDEAISRRAQALEVGAVLEKPLSKGELMTTLQQILDRST